MAEITNELIYEVLKPMQARLSNIEETLREHKGQFLAIRGDLRSIHMEMGPMKSDSVNIYESTGAMDTRLSRIERRLEIIDLPIS